MIKPRLFLAIVILAAVMWGLANLPAPRYADLKKTSRASNDAEPQTEIPDSALPPAAETAEHTPSFFERILPHNIIPAKPSDSPQSPSAVPFTPQAPFADWADPRQQDGCEEASMIMAWHWLNSTTFTKAQALEEILALSKFEEQTIGEWRSTSAEDTAKIFKSYYNYENITVQYDISSTDIISELNHGNLVLTPTDGRKLGNPYYKQPGPPEHMLVIFDYDEKKDEFITNDPGTRRGQNYRYKSAVVLKAIVDYPTGHREANPNPRTAMIVISPQKLNN